MDVSMNISNNVLQNPVEEEIVPADNGFSLNKIWDDSHLLCYFDDNQKKRWRCLWCNENYSGWHATKALIHLAKELKMDIAPCKAYLPDEDAKTYCAVFDRYMAKKSSCSSAKLAVAQSIEANNEASAALLTHS
jgi:BED zinc finger